jgi:hypothetical protein
LAWSSSYKGAAKLTALKKATVGAGLEALTWFVLKARGSFEVRDVHGALSPGQGLNPTVTVENICKLLETNASSTGVVFARRPKDFLVEEAVSMTITSDARSTVKRSLIFFGSSSR